MPVGDSLQDILQNGDIQSKASFRRETIPIPTARARYLGDDRLTKSKGVLRDSIE
jgi:hypothetical protein